MRLARMNDCKTVGAAIEPYRRVGFGISNHVVILAGSLACFEDLYRVVECTGFLENSANEKRHRRAGPFALAAAAHLADRDLLVVHSRDGADKSGESDVCKWDTPFGLGDDKHRVFLQFPVDAVIEHTAMQQSSRLRYFSEQCEAAAVEEFGDRIREEDRLGVHVQGVCHSLHFFNVALGNVGPLDGKNCGNCLLDWQRDPKVFDLFFLELSLEQVLE